MPLLGPLQAGPWFAPWWAARLPVFAWALCQANGWDVTLVRILTVVGFLFSGGLVGIAYLAGWVGIPEEPMGTPGAYPPSV